MFGDGYSWEDEYEDDWVWDEENGCFVRHDDYEERCEYGY